MTGPTEVAQEAGSRVPLSRSRVFRAAVELADHEGLDSLTMRRLAQGLGVEAMSLYHHVANKEALLDGAVEEVLGELVEAVGQLEELSPADDWRQVMRARILAAREVLLRYAWAPRVLETRTTMSPVIIGYYDGLLGVFRDGGFSYDLAHHAMHVLGSRALGFTQELFEPDADETDASGATAMLEQMADQFPYIVGTMAEVGHDDPDATLGWCDDQFEFEFALDLILDGLERLRTGG